MRILPTKVHRFEPSVIYTLRLNQLISHDLRDRIRRVTWRYIRTGITCILMSLTFVNDRVETWCYVESYTARKRAARNVTEEGEA